MNNAESFTLGRRTVVLILGVILLAWTAAWFLPARHFQFVNWDDFNEVVQNPQLHPPTAEHLRQIWAGPHLRMYAPLSYTAWWLLTRFAGGADNPAAFHVLNIVLHLACAALVFSILLACVKSPLAAFGGAVLFALHPIQVESVAWVSEMNNLLAAGLSLAAIRLYLAFCRAPGKSRWVQYFVALAIYLLALLAKPTAVAAPLIAVALDWAFVRGSGRRAIAALWPWFVAAAVFAVIAHLSQPGAESPFWSRPIVAIDALAFYCGKIIWPAGFTIDYGRTPARIVSGYLWATDLAVVALLVAVLWLLWRNYRGIAVGAIVMFLGLLPVLGLAPFAFQEYSSVADHFVYLAMLGPALALAVILAAAGAKWAMPVSAALALVLAALSMGQLKIWHDSGTLVARELAIDPGSAIGNAIVGAELNRLNDPARAAPYFRAAIARDPSSSDFHYNLGNAFFQMGAFEKSIDEFNAAIALERPPSWRTMNNLGVAYAKIGRKDEAVAEFHRVLEMDPDNAEAKQNLRVLSAGVPSR